MLLPDAEQKKLLEEMYPDEPITERVLKSVTAALLKLRVATIDDVDRVWKVANEMDKRERKKLEAERHAAATLTAQLPKD